MIRRSDVLFVLFFLSGVSGLLYQVVWVRAFGNVFGNTVYSASLVIAIFMLGLAAGSALLGTWADRSYRRVSLLRTYGYLELAIAALGLGISILLPHLSELSALTSSYSQESGGWFVPSTMSHVARAAIAITLLTPITVLMGGTLTVLIRHLVGHDVRGDGWQIAVLYAVNTGGAALGSFLTDFAFVPAWGLQRTQIVAVGLNIAAAVGAFHLANAPVVSKSARQAAAARAKGTPAAAVTTPVVLTGIALALSGFGAMGMEIVWFRHFSILLGEFRAVFSLLLTVILVGIAIGALAGSYVHRRTNRPAAWLMLLQGTFVAATLLGLAAADASGIRDAVRSHSAYDAMAGGIASTASWARMFEEVWFNLRPMLVEIGAPAFLMGFAFPLANSAIQDAERTVGRRAGFLYLSNTVGAVLGSLAAGFLLLPWLGMQGSATVLMAATTLSVLPLYFATTSRATPVVVASLAACGVALAIWLQLPSNYLISRAVLLPATDRVLAMSEGINEVVTVSDVAGQGRLLMTNGHPMSSTDALSQRYMRALAHLPLLSIEHPTQVLVICFGVGNTAHAATLHPSVERVEVVDISRQILEHAGYFSATSANVLMDPRVAVYLNDGRHHLQMQRESVYDLITLEPPPIVQAGVASLYSTEFYARARTRLTPQGYISQWLPVNGVPAATTLALIRAFIDVFPEAVLVSGAHTNLLLIGTKDGRVQIDPATITAALSRAPSVRADLQRFDLGTAREIVGSFVGSARTLVDATRESAAVTDDRPIQEYGVRSRLNFGEPPPPSIVNLDRVAEWCPACFIDGKPVVEVAGLDAYLSLLSRVYTATVSSLSAAPSSNDGRPRVIAGSAYLGAVVPESADLHTTLGLSFAADGDLAQAITHLDRAVQLAPDVGRARYELATTLLESGRYAEAEEQFRAAIQLMPDSAEAWNNLGVALASQKRMNDAIAAFEQALTRRPDFADARRNLAAALQQRVP